MGGNLDRFISRAQEVKEVVMRMKAPLIVNHYDCDGITSGSIACAALESRGVPYRVKTIRKLDDDAVEQLENEKEIIFTDLGGGNKRVNELSAEVVILDHHQTEGIEKLQLNPQLFGFDGGIEVSASGTSYFAFGEKLEIAIVGAVGDMQYPLRSLNKIIVEEGVKQGKVVAEIDLRMYGRQSRPLPQLLAYSDDPFLPFLGGHEDRCAKFLEDIGIQPKQGTEGKRWPTYSELGSGQKKKLIGALAIHLAENAYGRKKGEDAISRLLVGETYVFPRYKEYPQLYDAGEFSTMLNACGRHQQPQLGIDICLEREGAFQKGKQLLALHKKMLREGIEFAYRNVRDWGMFLFLDGRGVIEDGIIGVVAGMLYPGGRAKPIIALALDEKGKVKISGRGTAKLIKQGLNLGLAIKQAVQKCNGVGGGHRIAAGASIPSEKLDEFLSSIAQEIEKQIGD